jgi:hypothetical protein
MRNALRPHSESHMRIADATDGRTNGTKNRIDVASNLKAVDAGAHGDEPTRISDLLDPAALWPNDRHPVVRSGERNEIPQHVRVAVWLRDRGKCELCGDRTPEGQPWHLDHIVPWSAGGSDATTNLRVLCERHNMDRGNRVDPTERPRRAATWWCVNCYANEGFPWRYANGMPTCLTHNADPSRPGKSRCSVVNGYRTRWVEAGEWPTWHQRSPIDEAHTVAHCAHCHAPGLTDKPL